MKEVLLLLFGDEFREYFSLTARQKFYVWYFCLSLCFLCITDDSPIWAIIVVVLNFANAARLIKKVPLNIKEDYSGKEYFTLKKMTLSENRLKICLMRKEPCTP